MTNMRINKKALIMIGIVAAAGAWMYRYHSAPAAAGSPVVWVEAAPVKETMLPLEIRTIGSLTARSVEISPEVAGHVETVLFQDGAYVAKGVPLIQLDDTVHRAKYDSVNAELNYLESNFKRMSLIGKKGIISKDAIDHAESLLMQKRALKLETQAMLEKMQLRAPFEGVLGKSSINPGDYVNTGRAVVTLTDIDHLRVEYAVSEKYVGFLKLGQSVTVTVSAYPAKVFTGKLGFISPTINPDNRSLSLYAEIDNHEKLLKAGMLVNVSQTLSQNEHAIMIPARSLMPSLNGQQVYKIVDGKAFATTIQLGKRTENAIQVTEGLSPGDVVITDGQLKVNNGMSVNIKS